MSSVGFDDGSKTENTYVYLIQSIIVMILSKPVSKAGHEKSLKSHFLNYADAASEITTSGCSRLTRLQTLHYHYQALLPKLAGTERGVTGRRRRCALRVWGSIFILHATQYAPGC